MNTKLGSPGDVGLVPSTFSLFGRTHYYQVPPNPKGTLVFLHGCARSATGFWPASPKAPECTGFPEDVSRTIQALTAGYAMLAPTPQNPNLCFSAADGDFEKLIPIIERFWALTGLKTKPLFLGGASAGGSVAVRFPGFAKGKLQVDGMLLEVSTNQSPKPVPDYPPTVWVCMERDKESQREAKEHAAGLTQAKVGAAVVVSPTRKVTDTYFSDRMVSVTAAQSKQVVKGLRAIGLVDATGALTSNPKDGMAAWMNRLKPHMPAGQQFTLGSVRKSPVFQALAVAWAEHEHVADYTTAAIKFFEADGKADMKELVARHTVNAPTKLCGCCPPWPVCGCVLEPNRPSLPFCPL